MKKKIFLILTMVAIFALVLALGVSAATYNYYEDEIKDENLLYTAETMVAKDFKNNGQQTRYEAIRQDSGKGFAKYDANNNPLTWYVVSETVLYDGTTYIGKNIVVASTLTNGGAGTIDENGLYTYGGTAKITLADGTEKDVTAGDIVSANFFGLNVKSFPEALYKATVSDKDRELVGTLFTNDWRDEYTCVAAPGSYLNFLYLPETLESVPNKFCYRSPLRVLEFENNETKCTTFPRDAFQFCASLKTLIIPEGITVLQNYAKVKEANAAGKVIDIEYATFRECLSLEFVKFPDSLTEVPENVFYNCVSIHTVIYGEYTTYIGRMSKSYGRFGFGASKQDNVNIKYVYIPSTLNRTSYFDEWRGTSGNETYVDKITNLVFFFDGSLEEAIAVGKACTAEGSHFNVALGKYVHPTDTRIKQACAPIDYATYILNKEYYDNLEGYLVVYNGDYCSECYGDGTVGELFSEYPDGFMKPGRKGPACIECGYMKEVTEVINPLFVSVGYSVSEVNYDAIMVGFEVDLVAINDYEEMTGCEVSYGLFVAKSAKLGTKTIFDENGNVNEGAAVVEMSSIRDYSIIELKVKGIDSFKKKGEALIMGGYAKLTKDETTEISYLQATEANEGEIYSTVRLVDYLTPEQAGALKVDQKDETVDFIIDAGALFG